MAGGRPRSRQFLVQILLLAMLMLAGSVRSDAQDAEQMARAVVAELTAGEFDKVTARLTPQMIAALADPGIAGLWRQIVNQVGPLKWINDAVTFRAGPLQRVGMYCTFEHADAILTFTFNPADKLGGIGGLRPIGPPSPAQLAAWMPPAYATPSAFEERDVSLGDRDPVWATLSMPTRTSPVPAVVIVGGSGPNDRDETVVPNRPMKDLAFGLASRGIAVLRYDKRNLVYPALFQPARGLTVKEEAIDDTLSAIALLAAAPGVDPARIVVVGHSLGGQLAPRIAAADRRVAGLVIMAGPSRPIEEVIAAQIEHLEPGNAVARNAVQAFATQINSAELTPSATVDLLGQQTSGAYWLDLRGYRQADVAATLDIPIFALQGERDYQVSMLDFAGWKQALAGRSTATFKSYPRLNHLFLEGTGTGRSLPPEYRVPGHIPEEVIADIAAWINALRPTPP